MTSRANPYVGPRPFTSAEMLPARDREVLELRHTLIAVRILVLHSPSGAGKTSLIEAHNGLRAVMQKRGFLVRPTLRVSGPPPAELAGRVNRYELSALRILDDDAHAPEDLAALGLAGWLDANTAWDTKPTLDDQDYPVVRRRELLLFDQFEEVLTAEPSDDAGREEFFERLAVTLEDPYRWALFLIREDYLGALDPWARRLPTLLTHRFRIDLLGTQAASEAIRGPAEAQGVRFDDDALQHLVNELRQTTEQALDGAIVRRTGAWVEPVHLQVVCLRLWSQLADENTRITLSDVQELGDVDVALANFYRDQMRTISEALAIPERRMRDWVGTKLISRLGVRTPVMRGRDTSDGISNSVIEAMESAHLVRGEERRGIKWYELCHDRMIAPILADNGAWEKDNLDAVQIQAALWDRQGQPDELLLGGDALAAADAWAATNAESITYTEGQYLTRSRERDAIKAQQLAVSQRLAEEQERRLKQFRLGVTVLCVALLFAIGVSVYAWRLAGVVAESEQAYKRTIFTGILDPLRASTEERLRMYVKKYESLDAVPETSHWVSIYDDLRFYLLITGPKRPGEPLPSVEIASDIAQRISGVTSDAISPEQASMSQAAAEFLVLSRGEMGLEIGRDAALIELVREIALREAPERVKVKEIVDRINDDKDFRRISLRDLIDVSLITNDNVDVRAAFTVHGWERVKAEFIAINRGDSWVLGLSEERAEVLRQRRGRNLRSLYFIQYIQEWRTFIRRMRMASPGSIEHAKEVYGEVIRGPNGPLEQVFMVLQENVNLKDDFGSEVSVSSLFGMLGDQEAVRSTVLVGDVRREFAPILEFALPSLGEKAEVSLGQYHDRVRTLHGKIDKALMGEGGRRDFIRDLRYASEDVQAIVRAAELDEWESAVMSLLMGPLVDLVTTLDDKAGVATRDYWCNNVVKPMHSRLYGRYPFAADSGAEVSLAEFAEFFHPQTGVIRRAREMLLTGGWVARNGESYEAHVPGKRGVPRLDPEVAKFLSRADEIGTVLFVAGEIQIDFSISLICWINNADFQIAGEVRQFNCDGTWPPTVSWPGRTGQGASFTVRGGAGRKTFEAPGEWGLFAVLERASRVTDFDGVQKFTFDLNPYDLGEVEVRIKPVLAESGAIFLGPPGLEGRYLGLLRVGSVFPPKHLFTNRPGCD